MGLAILKKQPRARVAILEKYGYIGGRVTTYRKGPHHIYWENGAGRISSAHKKVLGLLRHYGLTTAQIPAESQFRARSDMAAAPFPPSSLTYDKIVPTILDPITNSLSSHDLATQTLVEILAKSGKGSAAPAPAAAKVFERFPYWAEPNLLRADLAIKSFQGELGAPDSFVVCKEGLGALTAAMRADFEKRGGIVYIRTDVQEIHHDSAQNCDIVSCIRKDPLNAKNPQEIQVKLGASVTILALHAEAAKEIFKRSLPDSRQPEFLRHLAMAPLLRMYAVFPVRNGLSWFSGIPHTVTPGPIRYFIPINPAKGVVMISYTEGPDATYWIKKMERNGEDSVRHEVMREIRALFKERKPIPEPYYFKMHPWYEGCTYWLPGKYDPVEESRASLYPVPSELPTTFLCGESTSLRQAWMEGAIEQAEKLENLPIFQRAVGRL